MMKKLNELSVNLKLREKGVDYSQGRTTLPTTTQTPLTTASERNLIAPLNNIMREQEKLITSADRSVQRPSNQPQWMSGGIHLPTQEGEHECRWSMIITAQDSKRRPCTKASKGEEYCDGCKYILKACSQ